jgi:hypothetical protein
LRRELLIVFLFYIFCLVYLFFFVCVCVCVCACAGVCVCVCVWGGECVKHKNVNSKCTHRRLECDLQRTDPASRQRGHSKEMTTNSRPKLLKRKQNLVKRPQSGLDTKTY